MHKDVTVSKLSKLQKRMLIYARQQMLAKAQKIEPREHVVLCFDAPPWLNDALTATLGTIFTTRDGYFGPLAAGRAAKERCHRYTWFFEEVAFAETAIWEAAQAAGEVSKCRLTELYLYAVPVWIPFAVEHLVAPWPGYDSRWFFKICLIKTNVAVPMNSGPGWWTYAATKTN